MIWATQKPLTEEEIILRRIADLERMRRMLQQFLEQISPAKGHTRH